jgi:hypothetical protein
MQNQDENLSTLELGRGALTHWGLEEDRIATTPLSFEDKNSIDREFLVETKTVHAMRDIQTQLRKNFISRIVLLFGDRGAGKTSAMRFLRSLLEDDPDIAFIECPIQLDTSNVNEFRKYIYISLLTRMVDFLLERELIDGKVHGAIYDTIDKGNHAIIASAVEAIFKKLSSAFLKRIIFLDDLDKVELEKHALLTNYFTIEQSFYNIFTKRSNTYVFLALQENPGIEFTKDKNINWISGKTLIIKPWTDIELDNLLINRLEKVYVKGRFDLNRIFTSEARIIIYNHNRYNPRWSLIAVKKLLQKGYEENKNIIDGQFCLDNIDELSIVRDGHLVAQHDYHTLEVHLKHLYKAPNTRIENVIKRNVTNKHPLIKTLVSIFKDKEVEDRVALNKLLDEGLVIRNNKKYSLANDITKLFAYADNILDGDQTKIFYFLMQFWNF